MEFQENTTEGDIMMLCDRILSEYAEGTEKIERIKEIHEGAVRMAEVASEALGNKLKLLCEYDNRVAVGFLCKLMAITYLAAISEVIYKKQEHEQKKYNSMLNTINGNKSFGPSAGKSY